MFSICAWTQPGRYCGSLTMSLIRDCKIQHPWFKLCHLLNEVENFLRNVKEGNRTTYCRISNACSGYASCIVSCVVLCVYQCGIYYWKYKCCKRVMRNLHVNWRLTRSRDSLQTQRGCVWVDLRVRLVDG